MDALGPSDIFLFEGFRLDRAGLFRRTENGAFVPVKIGSRALDILKILIDRAGELVGKEEIIAQVWPGRVVEDSNLTVQISALRHILDRAPAQAPCIQTVASRGYRFVASVTSGEADRNGAPVGKPALPRLSIVVLPFANLSNDPDEAYFVDAMTDDLTTDLSRLADMFVISRGTAFTYREKQVSARHIGCELSVRYVLEGSVRRLGNRVRVNAQLIDTGTDAHLWAERFDGDTGDLFAVHDNITRRIAAALNLEVLRAEAARATESPDALDYILRGRAELLRPPSRERRMAQIRWFERALALEPDSTEAQSWSAAALAGRVLDNMTDSAVADVMRAEMLAAKALAASPGSARAHYAKGQVLRAQRRWAEAIPEYDTVLELNRNWVVALSALAHCKLFNGSIDEVIPLEEQAIRLSPRDPEIGLFLHRIGLVHLLQSRTDEAIVWYEKARTANPALPYVRDGLSAAYALKGQTDGAAAELAEARRLSADDRFSSLARLRARIALEKTSVRTLYEATYFVGLRKAGMPDE